MKTFLIIMSSVLLLGCSTTTPTDPFVRIPAGQVATIAVGTFKKDEARNETEFIAHFLVQDPKTVSRLTQLVKTGDRIEPYLPGIGGLSCQQFRDAKGRPLAVTWIVNYGCRIAINSWDQAQGDYYVLTHSEEYCRIIYDLMVANWPEEIEQQQKDYARVGQSLEALLFGTKRKAEPTAAPDSPARPDRSRGEDGK